MDIYYIDGQYVEKDKAVIPATDLAVLRGYGIFDYLRTYKKKPFHLKEHLDRLERSASFINLKISAERSEIEAIIGKTLEMNIKSSPEAVDFGIRIVVTGGSSPDFITPPESGRILVMISPFKPFPKEWYEKGVKILTRTYERSYPGAKSIDYITAIVTMKQAKEAGGAEVVYVDGAGNVLEGTTSNIFIVKKGKLATPDDRILPGITREVTLNLIRESHKPEMRKVPLSELLAADEVFLTSSNKEILPVVTVNDRKIAEGEIGPVTKDIMNIFKTYVASL